ncbi:MAG: CIA30 family protein [Bacteroidota bacterium]
MKTFLILLIFNIGLLSEGHKLSFKESASISNWRITNDGVMGGLSKGAIQKTDRGILFSGEVSLKNFGGFTSYKSEFKKYNLEEYTQVDIKYRSTGTDMAIQLETSRQFFAPYFKANLPVSPEWVVKTVDFNEFKQYQMGEAKNLTMQDKDLKNVIRVGFITNEKKAGAFEFEVDYIEFK